MGAFFSGFGGLAVLSIILFLALLYPKRIVYLLPLAFSLSPEIIVGQTAAREITLRLEDFLIAVLLLRIAFDFITVRFQSMRGNVLKKLTPPIFSYSLCLILATTYGVMLRHVAPGAGFFYVIKLIQFFLFFYVFYYYISDEKDVKIILASAFIALFICSLIGYYQIPTSDRTTMPFEGASSEPNTFGGYYVLLLSILGALFAHEPKGRKKTFYAALIGFSILPFIYTGSRTSWFAALITILAFLLLTKGFHRKTVILALIIITIMSIPLLPGKIKQRAKFWVPEEGYQKTQTVGRLEFDPSGSDRIAKYKMVPQEWPRSPIFGFGVAGRGFIDGQYIRVILETGLLGVTAFCYLFFMIFQQIFTVYKYSQIPLQKSLALGLLCGTIGLLFHGLGATTFYIVRISEPYWMFLALMCSYSKFSVDEKVKAPMFRKIYSYPYLIETPTPVFSLQNSNTAVKYSQ